MQLLATETLLAQLRWRYAVKKFDSARKIPAADWAALEEALVLTPSSFGLQPWKFLVVTNQAIKDRLVSVSWNQSQPAQCSHMVVFAIKRRLGTPEIDRWVRRIAEVRGMPVDKLESYRQIMVGSLTTPRESFRIDDWAALQLYIALGNFMTSAALLGIDTCPMEGIDPAKYDEILGLTNGDFGTVVACPAGYRAVDDKYAAIPKVRYAVDDVIVRIN